MSGGYNNSVSDCEVYNNNGNGLDISNGIKTNASNIKAAFNGQYGIEIAEGAIGA